MVFEIATASADDVRRIMGWAKDEGWNPANTDWVAFHAVDPGAFLIGRLDGEPVVSISVTRYGAGFGFLGRYNARPVVRGKGYGIRVWIAGTIVLTIGVALVHTGRDTGDPFAAVGSIIVLADMLLFGWLVYRGEREPAGERKAIMPAE